MLAGFSLAGFSLAGFLAAGTAVGAVCAAEGLPLARTLASAEVTDGRDRCGTDTPCDGLNALAKVEAQAYAAILMDCEMPRPVCPGRPGASWGQRACW